MELIQKLVPVCMLVFVLSSMLAMGFGLTVGEIVAPLRNVRRVVMSLLANFLLVPLVLPLLLSGVSVDSAKIARSLFLLMLLPLAAALVLKARFPTAAARTRPILDRISNLSLILFTLLLVTVNVNNVLAVFGTRAILAGLLFIAISFGTGWLLGGPDTDARRVLALGTAQRNIAAALVVGAQSFKDPKVVVMVIVVAIVGLLILMPLSRTLARISLPAPETDP